MVNCPNCREEPSNLDKWKFSLIGTIIVFLIFNPVTEYIIKYYLGAISNKYLKSSIPGYIFGYILFMLLVRTTM
jgi:putative effector of murein hydrolase LrgA (UPF0299 family)